MGLLLHHLLISILTAIKRGPLALGTYLALVSIIVSTQSHGAEWRGLPANPNSANKTTGIQPSIEPKPAQLNVEPPPALSLLKKTIDGVTISYAPSFDIEYGNYSNPDGLVIGQSTRFVKSSADMTFNVAGPSVNYSLSLSGSRYSYLDFEKDSDRYELQLFSDGVVAMGPDQTLELKTTVKRDFVPLTRLDTITNDLEFIHNGKKLFFRMEAVSHVELNRSDDSNQGNQLKALFDVSRLRAFDYSKTDGEFELVAFSDKIFQPFFLFGYSDINYFHQVSNPILDRTAKEHWLIGGIRVKPNDTFSIDLGMRYNNRDFKDTLINAFQSDYFDMRLNWKPIETLQLTGLVERVLKEPSTLFGLADDVTTYGITASYQLTPSLDITLSGFHIKTVPIGEVFYKTSDSVQVDINYQHSDNLNLYVNMYGRREVENTFDTHIDQYEISSGVQIKF